MIEITGEKKMQQVTFNGYPPCPKCTGHLVPLSGVEEKYRGNVPIVFEKWACTSCGHEVKR
jgi:uncharacterized protein with PIN domain